MDLDDIDIDLGDVLDLLIGLMPKTLFGVLVWLVVSGLIIGLFINSAPDCGKRQCIAGTVPQVVKHECVCVSKPTK